MQPKHHDTLAEDSGRFLFIKQFGTPIEEYASFKRATESLKERTFKNYRRVLPYYFMYLKMNPDQVIAKRIKDLKSDDSEDFERRTYLYLRSLVDRRLSGKAVNTHRNRIQGFFSNNGKRLSLELDVSKLKISKARKRRKYSPTYEEAQMVFNKADSARDHLIVALMRQNGPSPIDVSLLCCGDYPREPWVCFERNRSKTGEVWYGVSMPDVCDCLNAYLNVRGNWKDSDPLFVGREGPLDADAISGIVHDLIVSVPELKGIVGFKPTSFRDAFEDALVDAEVYHKVKEALMAHSSGIENEYGSQSKMSERLVEAAKKIYPLLCLNEANRKVDSLGGLSASDLEQVREIAKNADLYRELRDLLVANKLVNVDDPKLVERLRAEGKIK